MSDKGKLSYKTLAICSDVAIYFAEVFRKHNKGVSWSFFTKPKTHDSINKPVLLGFVGNQYLNARRKVYICTLHYIDGDKGFDLYGMYRIWKEDVKIE